MKKLGMLVLLVVGVTLAPTMAEALDPANGGAVPLANVQGKKLLRWAAELTNKTLASEVPGKVKAWQQAGYDGLCFNISSHRNGSEPEVLHKEEMFFRWWNLTKRTREEFAPDIEAFKSVKDWGCLTDNFLLTAVRPLYEITKTKADASAGGERCPDWFKDADFEIVLWNARLAATIAKEVGFKGIVFDVEAYAWAAKGAWSNPWSYPDYASGWYRSCGHAEPLPFAEVAAKVRERGKQWAQAISEEFPDIVLLVAPSPYEGTWESCVRDSKPLSMISYGLLPAFTDGIVLGLNDKASLVFLSEATYMMSQYRDMVVVRDMNKEQALVVSSVPELARQRIRFAVGLWTDAAYGVTGSFSNTDASINHRSPQRHRHATSNALAVSDGYAWHYGEMSYFLVWGEGYPFEPGFKKMYAEPPALIREYWQANEQAHEGLNLFWKPEPPVVKRRDYSRFDMEAAERNGRFWETKEKEGFKVITTLPEYWMFLWDPEMEGRFGKGTKLEDYPGWLRVSSKRCWQSQGIWANGDAFYGTTFEVPADLDVNSQEVFVAFGAYGSGSVNIYLNGEWIDYIPNTSMPDVTKKIKVGENTLVLGFLNRSGPAGLAGDVKIIGRDRK